VIGGFGLGVVILPDYSRFIARTDHAVAAVGLALGPIWAVILGAYAAAGLVTQSDDPTTMLLALGLPAIVTLFLPIGLLQNSIMCLYSSALATSTCLRGVKFAIVVTVTAAIGMILAIGGVQSVFVGFLVLTSAIFPPAAATLACEALFRPADEQAPRTRAGSASASGRQEVWWRSRASIWGSA
jgi:cytosine permease